MATINVYEQYFKAEGIFSGVERKAVNVMLVSDSEAGTIRYELGLSFFPQRRLVQQDPVRSQRQEVQETRRSAPRDLARRGGQTGCGKRSQDYLGIPSD